jgi:NADH-quinone oxidoreductase subunit M
MGLPGFSGFVAEISVIIGLWQAYPWLTIAVARHHHHRRVLAARAAPRVFPGKSARPVHPPPPLPPLTLAGNFRHRPAARRFLAIGIYPKPWVTLIDDGLRSPIFQSILTP